MNDAPGFPEYHFSNELIIRAYATVAKPSVPNALAKRQRMMEDGYAATFGSHGIIDEENR